MPRRAAGWKGEARANALVWTTSGHIHGAHFGHTRVVRLFGKAAYGRTIASFCSPYFRVVYDDGDSVDYCGHEIKPNVVYRAKELEDPRLWSGDYSFLHMTKVPGFHAAILGHLGRVGIKVPSAWLRRDDNARGTPILASCVEGDPSR